MSEPASLASYVLNGFEFVAASFHTCPPSNGLTPLGIYEMSLVNNTQFTLLPDTPTIFSGSDCYLPHDTFAFQYNQTRGNSTIQTARLYFGGSNNLPVTLQNGTRVDCRGQMWYDYGLQSWGCLPLPVSQDVSGRTFQSAVLDFTAGADAANGNLLYLGGQFSFSVELQGKSVQFNGLALWNSTSEQWLPLPPSPVQNANSTVVAVATAPGFDGVFFGGDLTEVKFCTPYPSNMTKLYAVQ
jgi:hypothetical protein